MLDQLASKHTMKILRLDDPCVRTAARHPALAGLPRIGRGAFCTVYDKGETVLKLTCDTIQYAFYADLFAPKGDYFPRLVRNYGDVGETSEGMPLYLFEMEKLTRLSAVRNPTVKRLVKKLVSRTNTSIQHKLAGRRGTLHDHQMASLKCLEDLLEEQGSEFEPGLLNALELTLTFLSNYTGCVLDIHNGNVMMRGEQLVLNDIVCDYGQIQKYNREEIARHNLNCR